MIYSRRRRASGATSGFYRFESMRAPRNTIYGSGDGEFILLRDEFGTVWRGAAERLSDDSVHFRFRNEKGKTISGVSDSWGVVLRDERGNTWRGFVD
ncbi:MAG: hypothetical protein SFV51_07930 [Bryobacteraceae bacterium]|nr:hypothetical protein [Bryobacteraceae bacterium]